MTKILAIDTVFFQYFATGIARVWLTVLDEWSRNPPPFEVVLLEREGAGLNLPAFKSKTLPRHDYDDLEGDRARLQKALDEIGADLFTSTYFSRPLTTPMALLVHDMIPERMGADLDQPMWREKEAAIKQAMAFCCVSQNTADDLIDLYPSCRDHEVVVNHWGVSANFCPGDKGEVAKFKSAPPLFGKPYFLYVGALDFYKNGARVVEALGKLKDVAQTALIVAGGHSVDPAIQKLAPRLQISATRFNDDGLRMAYSGAEALVFPSLYEGFGLPVIEAMACGCPVITSSVSSLPEVAGPAAIKINPTSVDAIAKAMVDIRKSAVRKKLVRMGLKRAEKFTWERSSQGLAAFFTRNL
jgi:glycosyltransferase involved in cell wall biosynthesis